MKSSEFRRQWNHVQEGYHGVTMDVYWGYEEGMMGMYSDMYNNIICVYIYAYIHIERENGH